jgi:hypothetical protein
MWAPFLAYGVLAGDARLVRFFPDYAFYYLQPASAMAQTGRATFDGVHLTNGFQPLNFLVVAGVAWVSGKARLLPAVFLVHTALVWVSLWRLACAWVPRRQGRVGIVAIGAAALPPFTLFLWLSLGMEATVLLAAVVALAVAWSAEGPERPWWRGTAMALLVLARLDAAVALIPFALASVVRVAAAPGKGRWGAARAALATWSVPLVAIAAYSVVNVWAMGRVLPISVYVKVLGADGQAHTWEPSTRGSVLGWAIVLVPLAAAVLVLGGAGVARWRARSPVTDEAMDAVGETAVLLSAASVLYYAYLVVAVRLVFRWYFALPLAVLMVTIVAAARWWDRRRGAGRADGLGAAWIAAAVAASAVSSAAVLGWIGGNPASTSFHLREIARRVSGTVPPGGVVAVADAGAIGFFADRRVVNVDGLASDYEFVDEFLRRGRLREYLAREGVTHYLVRDTHLANRDAVLARRGDAGRVIFDQRIVLPPDRELWRYEIPGQFTVILFRLD